MESYLIHVRYMCEDGGSGWESNPPPPTMRSRPLVLKTRASTGTQPLPLSIVTTWREIVNLAEQDERDSEFLDSPQPFR